MTDLRPLADRVLVSGQVRADDGPALADACVRWAVNHRPDGEEPGQPTADALAQALGAHGIEVIHAPVAGYPSEDAVARTREVLDKARPDQKVLVFCRSGMRSTVAWARAERLAGASADDLRDAAAGVGYDLGRVPL